MWGLGVTFAELICGIPRLFPGKSETEVGILIQMFAHNREQYLKQKSGKQLAKDELDLCLKLLEINPESRLSAENSQKHSFFK